MAAFMVGLWIQISPVGCSVVRGEDRPDSDVDLLIDLADDRGFGDYLALAEELEKLLGRRVDLLIGRSLSPHFRPFIEAEARPL